MVKSSHAAPQDGVQIECLQQAKGEVKKLTEKLQARELEAQPGMTMLETFESNVNQVLNKARDDAGTSAQNSLLATNNVVRMVTAGSKGSFINISQVRNSNPRSTLNCLCISDLHKIRKNSMISSLPICSTCFLLSTGL